jgi:OOP family OmpA-OmpF porin
LALTVGGGTGILDAIGAPTYRVFGSVSYRHPKEEKPEPVPEPVREEVISVNTIHFEFDKSRVLPESYPEIEKVVDIIKSRPEVTHVSIEGHTDSKGSDEYNQGLSERRANSVMEELIKRGIPASKLTAMGLGESMPVATNETKEGRALNRRIEFRLQISPDAKINVVEDETAAPTFLEK